jgi:hypothetical protein
MEIDSCQQQKLYWYAVRIKLTTFHSDHMYSDHSAISSVSQYGRSNGGNGNLQTHDCLP